MRQGVVVAMYAHEKNALNRIFEALRERFPERIKGAYVFGSKARGDHGEWSDFDILVVVKDRNPAIEQAIISIFVDEELRSGLVFAPLVKDLRAFESEKKYNSPFYENLTTEGIPL
jgi:predicted nucleotidyltransferase